MYQITDRLFVGNIDEARQPASQVSAVLLVAQEYEIDAPGGVVYARIPLKEFGEAHSLTLASAVHWIERLVADNRVMVCCRVGMGRSVSVVMAYLCCVEGMAYADVLSLVSARRPGATPLPKLEETIQEVRRLRNSVHRRSDGLPRR